MLASSRRVAAGLMIWKCAQHYLASRREFQEKKKKLAELFLAVVGDAQIKGARDNVAPLLRRTEAANQGGCC